MKTKYFLSFQFLAFLTIVEISHALSCYDCSSKKDDTIETCESLPKHLIQSDADICSTITLKVVLGLEFGEKEITLWIRKGEKRKSAGGIGPGQNCVDFSVDDLMQYTNIAKELTKEEAKSGSITLKSGEKCKCKSEKCNRESLPKQKQLAEASAQGTGGGAIVISSSFTLVLTSLALILSVFQLSRLFY